jgi:hypothetical protein
MNESAVRRLTVVDRRRATAGDIALLRNLFADAHVELAVLPPDTRFVLVDMQFRAQRRQHTAQYPTAQHDILLVDGTEVGRLLIDRRASATSSTSRSRWDIVARASPRLSCARSSTRRQPPASRCG